MSQNKTTALELPNVFPRQGFRVVQVEECWFKSLAPLMAEVRSQMGSGPVYLSFDIDALDPGFAPGTGTPEIAGLTPIQVDTAETNCIPCKCDSMLHFCPRFSLSAVWLQHFVLTGFRGLKLSEAAVDWNLLDVILWRCRLPMTPQVCTVCSFHSLIVFCFLFFPINLLLMCSSQQGTLHWPVPTSFLKCCASFQTSNTTDHQRHKPTNKSKPAAWTENEKKTKKLLNQSIILWCATFFFTEKVFAYFKKWIWMV